MNDIRTITGNDIDTVTSFAVEAWRPVFDGLRQELGESTFRRVYPDWRTMQTQAVLATCVNPSNTVWVSCVDGRPVGFVAVSVIEEGAAEAGEVEMLAVEPAYQGQGIASALLDHAVSSIAGRGLSLAVVSTGGDPGHAAARALYEKAGFRATRQVRYYLETAKETSYDSPAA